LKSRIFKGWRHLRSAAVEIIEHGLLVDRAKTSVIEPIELATDAA
jgi:hypothetical protein